MFKFYMTVKVFYVMGKPLTVSYPVPVTGLVVSSCMQSFMKTEISQIFVSTQDPDVFVSILCYPGGSAECNHTQNPGDVSNLKISLR